MYLCLLLHQVEAGEMQAKIAQTAAGAVTVHFTEDGTEEDDEASLQQLAQMQVGRPLRQISLYLCMCCFCGSMQSSLMVRTTAGGHTPLVRQSFAADLDMCTAMADSASHMG